MFTLLHARRPRGLFAALALVAFTFGTLPLASPAAPAPKPASAKTAAKKAAAATKSPAKKPAAKPVGYHPRPGLAPADEYFGRLQMSVLGVRNKVKDLGLDADLHPEHEKAILGNAMWVEDAMRDWAKKYPFDRWLPRYAYALEVMYERIPSTDAHRRAVKQISYLTAYFPQTVYGKIGRAKLALGVPTPDPSETPAAMSELERLALLDGKVLPTLPPAPAPSATPAPASAAPAAGEAVPASEAPVASPSPSTSPSPAPIGTLTPMPRATTRPASP